MAEVTRISALELKIGGFEDKLGAMGKDMDARMKSLEIQHCETMDLLKEVVTKIKKEVVDSAEGRKSEETVNTQSSPFGKHFKIEIPHFDGTEAEGWAFKIREFFEIYPTPLEQCVRVAAVHFEGSAAEWYRWLRENNIEYTWDGFLKALVRRFGRSLYDCPKGALKDVKQTSTVLEYQSRFESITTRVKGLTDDWMVSFFIHGLRTSLKHELLRARPHDYYEVVSMAKLHEQIELDVQQTIREEIAKPTSGNYKNSSTYSVRVGTNSAGKSVTMVPRQGITPVQEKIGGVGTGPKKFTAAEIKARREKGLCYYCDEKYTRNHKCAPSLSLLIEQDELMELLAEGDEFVDAPGEPVDESEMMAITPEISLNALEGRFHPRTLRVTGTYKKESLRVLIDSGSSYNVIRANVAKKLKLTMTAIKPFRVLTGSGTHLHCNNKCVGVTIWIQEVKFQVDLFVLEVSGCDVVLGVQWLASLGNVTTNYRELTMKFVKGGEMVMLKGNAVATPREVSNKVLKKLLDSNTVAGMYELRSVNGPASELCLEGLPEMAAELRTVLHKFKGVFAEPKTLPPKRSIDHRIELLPNCKPVNVRPY